jgi:hypothetical protein
MFVVKGYLNGIAYRVQVGVDKARANDGVVAGSPHIIGLLQSYEGLPITLGPGRRSVTGSTDDEGWVLAALYEHTEVVNVDAQDDNGVLVQRGQHPALVVAQDDKPLPDLWATRSRRPPGAVY